MKYNSKAFVSYSHDDSEDVSHFIKHIRPLERQGLVNVWHDKKIEPGDKWKEEIAKALDEANTAVLFISQSFLASDFIYEHELPLLLNAYLNGNLRIIPVFLSPSIVKSTEIIFTHPRTKEKKSINLAEIQGIGTPEKTLAHRTQTEQEELFVELAESIGASVSQHPSSGSVSYAEWALEKFGKLSMMGVEGGDIHLDMEKVFVPLRISQRNLDIDLEANRRQPVAWQARENSMGDVDLDKIFITPDGTLRQCVVLFGEPGAGKTTSLKKILHLCLNQGSSAFGLPRGIIPVFLRLRHFKDEFLHQPLEKFINKELNELSGERFPKELNRHLWSEGKLLLLFDGLDEIADSALRKKVAHRIAECMFAVQNKEIHAVVSCRYSGYDKGVDLKHFFPLDVRPLDQGQVESFVTLWFDEACKHYGDAEKNAIKVRSQRLLGSRETSESSGERIQLLMGNPLLLTLLCVVVLRVGEIPKRRAAFYQRCLEILLTRWRKDQAGVEPLLDVNAALNILSPLAWQLHTEKRKDDVKWLEFANFADSHLNTKEDAPSGLRVLEWLNQDTGIFIEYAPRKYGFMHLGLQEFLAAQHVVIHGEDGEPFKTLIRHVDEAWWREVVLLLVGIDKHRLFAPLIEHLLQGIAVEGRAELMRDLLNEAIHVDFKPVIDTLNDTELPVEQLTAILRLLPGVTEPEIRAAIIRHTKHSNKTVAELAKGLLGEGRTGKPYDLVVFHRSEDQHFARQLVQGLQQQGLQAWSEKKRSWPIENWMDHLDDIGAMTKAVLVVFGTQGSLLGHDDAEEGLRYLKKRCRLVAVRLLNCPEHIEIPYVFDENNIIESVTPSNLNEYSNSWVQALTGYDIEQKPVPDRGQKTIAPSIRQDIIHVFSDRLPGLKMLSVPKGLFNMGDEDLGDWSSPKHTVELSQFFLSETPVTNRQYGYFLKNTGYREPGSWREKKFSDPQQPVVGVDWYDAQKFCEWLSQVSGRVFFLPTEAQWEYAARGTDERRFPWGNNEPTPEHACYGLDYQRGKPALVGQYPLGRGPFGHLDLAGNVLEWCQDLWVEDAYKNRSRTSVPKDPLETDGNHGRYSVRGGSWDGPASALRVGGRLGNRAGFRSVLLGFRLAAPASLGS